MPIPGLDLQQKVWPHPAARCEIWRDFRGCDGARSGERTGGKGPGHVEGRKHWLNRQPQLQTRTMQRTSFRRCESRRANTQKDLTSIGRRSATKLFELTAHSMCNPRHWMAWSVWWAKVVWKTSKEKEVSAAFWPTLTWTVWENPLAQVRDRFSESALCPTSPVSEICCMVPWLQEMDSAKRTSAWFRQRANWCSCTAALSAPPKRQKPCSDRLQPERIRPLKQKWKSFSWCFLMPASGTANFGFEGLTHPGPPPVSFQEPQCQPWFRRSLLATSLGTTLEMSSGPLPPCSRKTFGISVGPGRPSV